MILMAALFLVMGTAANAGAVRNADNNRIYYIDSCGKNYNLSIDYNKTAFKLNLDNNELDYLKYIHGNFCKSLDKASTITNIEERNKLIYKSFDYELYNLRKGLSNEKYHMFLRILNKFLVENGFLNEIEEYGRK